MEEQTIIVTGPEASGSKLCARIVAHVTGACDFNRWNGLVWAPTKTKTQILHRSTPYAGGNFIDPAELIETYPNIKFIFTSRDNNISAKKYGYVPAVKAKWAKKNIAHVKYVEENKIPYTFFSYETFMLYRLIYLKELYKFLEVESNFIPKLIDGNIKYLK